MLFPRLSAKTFVRGRAFAGATLACGFFVTLTAFADDDEVFKQSRSNGMYLMERGSYAEAEAEFVRAARATSRSSRAWMYKHAGDAAFLREDYGAARRHYALGIATRFERDLWITTDNPGWADAVAGEDRTERPPLEIPQHGSGPNEVAPAPKRTPSYMPLPAQKSQHTREDRRRVNTISQQLKSSARRNSRDARFTMPVDPLTRGVPGSGIARVITPIGTCPAIRSTRGSYIASAGCLAAGGRFPATPWKLMHESGLHELDVCRVDDYWTREGKNLAMPPAAAKDDWAVLAVQSDCHPFFIESIPYILVNRTTIPIGTGKIATVEYADAFEQIVPVLTFCDTPQTAACLEGSRHYAAVWTQLGEETDGMRIGSWRFAGFVAPGGALADLATVPDLVSTLEKAWIVGQQRRTLVDQQDKAAAR